MTDIVWDVRTRVFKKIKDGKLVQFELESMKIKFEYKVPLNIYIPIFYPKLRYIKIVYNVKNMTLYHVLAAIATFYASNVPGTQYKYMNYLAGNYWFNGIIPVNDTGVESGGMRVIMLSAPEISALTLADNNSKTCEKVPMETPRQPITPSRGIPKLLNRQVPHLNRIENILSRWHAYMDTSPMGAGKTYVTCALAKKYGFKLMVVGELAVLGKWRLVSDLFQLEIAEIVTYDGIRGTVNRQPKTEFLNRTSSGFVVTEKFVKLVKSGVLLVFDEMQKLKNVTKQFEAATTLVNYIALSNEKHESNSRVALISATPADKPKHAYNIGKLLGIIRSKNLFFYDRSERKYKPSGLFDLYKWAKLVNEPLTNKLYQGTFNKTGMTEMGYKILTQVIIPSLASSMPMPENNIPTDYKNGFYKMGENDVKQLAMGISILNRAVAFLLKSSINNAEISNQGDIDDDSDPYATQNQTVTVGETSQTVSNFDFSDITRALIMIESAKINTIIRIAKKQLDVDKNGKVIIYVNYKNSIELIANQLQKYNPVILTGSIAIGRRNKLISQFQENNNNVRLLISITRIGSVGIDLDDKFGGHPRYMFIVPDYRFLDLYQATGRINRICTKSPATVRFIYGKRFQNENRILDALAKKTTTTKDFIVTDNPAPFPGDFDSYIEN